MTFSFFLFVCTRTSSRIAVRAWRHSPWTRKANMLHHRHVLILFSAKLSKRKWFLVLSFFSRFGMKRLLVFLSLCVKPLVKKESCMRSIMAVNDYTTPRPWRKQNLAEGNAETAIEHTTCIIVLTDGQIESSGKKVNVSLTEIDRLNMAEDKPQQFLHTVFLYRPQVHPKRKQRSAVRRP